MSGSIKRRSWLSALLPALASGEAEPFASLFNDRSGVAVALDVKTGKVAAAHRLDRAAARMAPPGSTVKPFVLAALIDAGKYTPPLVAPCAGQLRIGLRDVRCTHGPLARPVDGARALAYSCNNWFAKAALRMDPLELKRRLEGFGLTARTGLALMENGGEVRGAANRDELQLQALGLEDIVVTPLSMAIAYRRLAELRRRGDAKYSPVFEGLAGSTEYGTGQRAQPAGWRVAGKTGTASLSGEAAASAWFAGYAPEEEPRWALVVFLEQGRGSTEAAPVAAGCWPRLR